MRLDFVERRIAAAFRSYGRFVTLHPLPFVLGPVLLTLAMATGFLHLERLTDAFYLFTPTDALSKIERAAIHEKWPLSDGSYAPGRIVTTARQIQVIALARDGANILEKPYSDAVYRLDSFVKNRVKATYKNESFGYNELCLHFRSEICPGNPHVHIISDLFQAGVNITYPTMRFGTESGYIGSTLGGVTLDQPSPNASKVVTHARSWLFVYQLKFTPANESWVSGLWELELGRALQSYPEDPFISVTYFHSQTLAEELERNVEDLAPRFVISFTLLGLFAALCGFTFIDHSFYIDWVLSKPLVSVLGVLNALMAVATGIGGLVLIGVPFNDVIAVMPFLVVAVGTDNMFLMVAGLRRTSRTLPEGERMAECMAEAAVSILITVTVDVLSFGVGTITTIPAVQLFCVYTAVSLALTFIYQMTFFAALLSIFSRWESQDRNALLLVETKSSEDASSLPLHQRLFNLGSRPSHGGALTAEPAVARFFEEWYASVLMHPLMRCLALVWYLVYVAISAYGCQHLKTGLEPSNLLVEGSYAIPHFHLLKAFFWDYGSTLQIVVNNAPDLRNRTERFTVMKMALEMANSAHSAGLDSLQFWLPEMDVYYRSQTDLDLLDSAFYGQLRHFLAARPKPWSEDIYWSENESDEVPVTSFRFLIGMSGIGTTNEQQDATFLFRDLAAQYPSYNITTFNALWLFTDQYALVIPNTVQDVVIAVICMFFIAVLLIPQPMVAVWVAFTIGSIDFGVLGFMTLWGVNLDAISMITIIMSVGFAVDYSAHIAYGYVASRSSDPTRRIQDALGGLGWPVVQGGLSTILAVSVLATVPAYMIVTFFKTVFLAITLGLLHGLLFLPLLLSLFVRSGCTVQQSDLEENEGSKSTATVLTTV